MKHLPLGGAETERSRNLIKGETLKLEKNKYYRVTDQNGKKFRGSFDRKLSVLGQKCLRFCWEHHIIAVDLIKNVEQVEIITPDSQAREQGCWDEFKHYGTIKGKKAKRKFIYKELNKRGKIMRRLEMFLRYMIFISATILVVSHMVRGFNWYPLVFIWLTTLPLVLLKGEK